MSLMRCLSFTRGALRSAYFMTGQLQLSGHTCLRRLSTTSHAIHPILSVLPTRALVNEKFKVVVENLPPGSPVTLHSFHHSEDKDDWEAFGHYISDHRGTVSVAEDLSFGGTYTGKEPMGLLWSMRPVPGSRTGRSDSAVGRTNQTPFRRSRRLLEEDLDFSAAASVLQPNSQSQDVNDYRHNTSPTNHCRSC